MTEARPMKAPRASFSVRTHVVGIERTEKNRYVVTVDGRRFASFCSESRARAAGRLEARRLDLVARAGGSWRR
jgi:hypothetical protein